MKKGKARQCYQEVLFKVLCVVFGLGFFSVLCVPRAAAAKGDAHDDPAENGPTHGSHKDPPAPTPHVRNVRPTGLDGSPCNTHTKQARESQNQNEVRVDIAPCCCC